MDEDGYLFMVDRLKDMIITGGENVYSAEVENAMSQHPASPRAPCSGSPTTAGARRCTPSSCRDGAHNVTAEELIEHCRRRIAGYKVPARSSPQRRRCRSPAPARSSSAKRCLSDDKRTSGPSLTLRLSSILAVGHAHRSCRR